MKTSASVLVALSVSAYAADDPAWYGEANCRIARLEPKPAGDFAKWSGACKDGYAEGKGVLEWEARSKGKRKLEATLVRGEVSGEGTLTYDVGTYIGTFRNGVPHGEGYFKYANGDGLYEGGVAEGKRDGAGIFIAQDRSRYEGQWQAGIRQGFGRQTYTLGGSYEGQWKDDKFDGKGSIVYAGSGRKYEGQFREGRALGAAPREAGETGHFALKADRPVTGSKTLADRVIGYLPLTTPWEKLTPAQQNLQREQYPALDDGDEPPYPMEGPRKLFDGISRIYSAKFTESSGTLKLYILVGTDGKPKSVTAIGSPHPDLTRYASMVAMTQPFKPALCHGQPCEMFYPLTFQFESY